MKVVVAADEDRPVVAHVARRFEAAGHAVTTLPVAPWAKAALAVARAVAAKEADFGVVCCWTGTGVTIAANKVPGVRAALCGDARTAAGAREWNDANVLALSLRTLSDPVADEIVAAWLTTAYGGTEAESLEDIAAADRR